jgi:hypothetical protein
VFEIALSSREEPATRDVGTLRTLFEIRADSPQPHRAEQEDCGSVGGARHLAIFPGQHPAGPRPIHRENLVVRPPDTPAAEVAHCRPDADENIRQWSGAAQTLQG